MSRVFEDEFMDVQTDLLSLCLELAGKKRVDRIYVYGSIEKKSISFNTFYATGDDIATASGLAKNLNIIKEFLRIGTHDLMLIPDICTKYNRPVPTEIKLIYDCNKKSLDAKYQYDPVCTEETGLMPAQVFLNWKEEIAESRRSDENGI